MAAGDSGQFTPMRLPVNTVIHTTLVGLEPTHNPKVIKSVSEYFYRAMHFSAKRSIAIACRLSVRLSVCDVGEL